MIAISMSHKFGYKTKSGLQVGGKSQNLINNSVGTCVEPHVYVNTVVGAKMACYLISIVGQHIKGASIKDV